jgi:hypothetical protein
MKGISWLARGVGEKQNMLTPSLATVRQLFLFPPLYWELSVVKSIMLLRASITATVSNVHDNSGLDKLSFYAGLNPKLTRIQNKSRRQKFSKVSNLPDTCF